MNINLTIINSINNFNQQRITNNEKRQTKPS